MLGRSIQPTGKGLAIHANPCLILASKISHCHGNFYTRERKKRGIFYQLKFRWHWSIEFLRWSFKSFGAFAKLVKKKIGLRQLFLSIERIKTLIDGISETSKSMMELKNEAGGAFYKTLPVRKPWKVTTTIRYHFILCCCSFNWGVFLIEVREMYNSMTLVDSFFFPLNPKALWHRPQTQLLPLVYD